MEDQKALPIYQFQFEQAGEPVLIKVLLKAGGLRGPTWKAEGLRLARAPAGGVWDVDLEEPELFQLVIPPGATKKQVGHSHIFPLTQQEQAKFQELLAMPGHQRLQVINSALADLSTGGPEGSITVKSLRRTMALWYRQQGESRGLPLSDNYHVAACRAQGWSQPGPGKTQSTMLRYSKDWQQHAGLLNVGDDMALYIFGSPAIPFATTAAPQAKPMTKGRGRPKKEKLNDFPGANPPFAPVLKVSPKAAAKAKSKAASKAAAKAKSKKSRAEKPQGLF